MPWSWIQEKGYVVFSFAEGKKSLIFGTIQFKESPSVKEKFDMSNFRKVEVLLSKHLFHSPYPGLLPSWTSCRFWEVRHVELFWTIADRSLFRIQCLGLVLPSFAQGMICGQFLWLNPRLLVFIVQKFDMPNFLGCWIAVCLHPLSRTFCFSSCRLRERCWIWTEEEVRHADLLWPDIVKLVGLNQLVNARSFFLCQWNEFSSMVMSQHDFFF